MGFAMSSRLFALHLSSILVLLLVPRLASVRPVDGSRAGVEKVGVQAAAALQKTSSVQVEAQHFVLTKDSPKERQQNSVKVLTKEAEALAELKSHKASEPQSGNQKSEFPDEWDSASSGTNFLGDGSPKPSDELNREESFQVTNDEEQRPESLGKNTISTGSHNLDQLDEMDGRSTSHEDTSHEDTSSSTAKLMRDEASDQNPLDVSERPELSHDQQIIEAATPHAGLRNHFRELLKHKPVVEDAVNTYRSGVAKASENAKYVDGELDNTMGKVGQLHDEFNGVDKEIGHLGRATHLETRQAGLDSVRAFHSYNREGAYGSDEAGAWVPNVGKWNQFKDFLEEAQSEYDRAEKSAGGL